MFSRQLKKNYCFASSFQRCSRNINLNTKFFNCWGNIDLSGLRSKFVNLTLLSESPFELLQIQKCLVRSWKWKSSQFFLKFDYRQKLLKSDFSQKIWNPKKNHMQTQVQAFSANHVCAESNEAWCFSCGVFSKFEACRLTPCWKETAGSFGRK